MSPRFRAHVRGALAGLSVGIAVDCIGLGLLSHNLATIALCWGILALDTPFLIWGLGIWERMRG